MLELAVNSKKEKDLISLLTRLSSHGRRVDELSLKKAPKTEMELTCVFNY